MSTSSWVALSLAAAFAVLDWFAVATARKPVEYVGKPATLAALVAVAVTLHPVVGAQRTAVVVALLLSLAGDVFLMLPRDLFVAGLVSFLLAHLAYLSGFVIRGPGAGALVRAGLVMVAIAVAVGSRIVRAVHAGPHPELAAPVGAYLVVISAMGTAALATGSPWAGAGALLFVTSDALIAWTRFVRPLWWAPVAIIVTYHLAQAFLVRALAS